MRDAELRDLVVHIHCYCMLRFLLILTIFQFKISSLGEFWSGLEIAFEWCFVKEKNPLKRRVIQNFGGKSNNEGRSYKIW